MKLTSLYLDNACFLKEAAYEIIRPLMKALPASQSKLGLSMCGEFADRNSSQAASIEAWKSVFLCPKDATDRGSVEDWGLEVKLILVCGLR